MINTFRWLEQLSLAKFKQKAPRDVMVVVCIVFVIIHVSCFVLHRLVWRAIVSDASRGFEYRIDPSRNRPIDIIRIQAAWELGGGRGCGSRISVKVVETDLIYFLRQGEFISPSSYVFSIFKHDQHPYLKVIVAWEPKFSLPMVLDPNIPVSRVVCLESEFRSSSLSQSRDDSADIDYLFHMHLDSLKECRRIEQLPELSD